MKNSEKTILCIEDDDDTCQLIEFIFKQIDYEVISCITASEGLKKAESRNFSAVILDNWLSETTGVEICKRIRVFDSVTPIIFFSGEARPVEKQKAMNAGANEYLVKPDDLDRLTQTVINLIQKQ